MPFVDLFRFENALRWLYLAQNFGKSMAKKNKGKYFEKISLKKSQNPEKNCRDFLIPKIFVRFFQSNLPLVASNAWVNSWSNHPPPGICLIDSSRGSGICLSSFHVRARGPGIVIVAKDPGDLTNGCPESHPQILRQQNLVSSKQVGAMIVFCALVVKVA
jgi:hypothetical protein